MNESKKDPRYLAFIKSLTLAAGVALASGAGVGCAMEESTDDSADESSVGAADEQATADEDGASAAGIGECPTTEIVKCLAQRGSKYNVENCTCTVILGPLAPPDLPGA